MCAEFAQEVAGLEGDLAAGPALQSAADGLEALDSTEPDVDDLGAAMEDAAAAMTALVEAAAETLGVSTDEISVLVTDEGVYAYPAAGGLDAIVDVAGGVALWADADAANEARQQVADQAGLEDCAAVTGPTTTPPGG